MQVQPVAELVELSKRCMAPSTATVEEIDHSINNGNCNTLRRSASKRFKRQVSPNKSPPRGAPRKPLEGLRACMIDGIALKMHFQS